MSLPFRHVNDAIRFGRWSGRGMRAAQRLIDARALLFGTYEPEISAVIRKVAPYTMTSRARIAALCDAIRHVVRHGSPGDFVECGVWKGGSSMAAALSLLQLNDTTRRLYLFDTFAGMTPPSDLDRSATSGFSAEAMLKQAPRNSNVAAFARLDEVRSNMARTGYPSALIRLVEGPVEQTLPREAPQSIAVLRLDTDWYESTRHELVHLFPRLVSGGVLIIDDYGVWEGARRAVDEYFEEQQVPIFLHRIDHTGRIAIKP